MVYCRCGKLCKSERGLSFHLNNSKSCNKLYSASQTEILKAACELLSTKDSIDHDILLQNLYSWMDPSMQQLLQYTTSKETLPNGAKPSSMTSNDNNELVENDDIIDTQNNDEEMMSYDDNNDDATIPIDFDNNQDDIDVDPNAFVESQAPFASSLNDIHEIKLMKLVLDIGAPQSAYKSILLWARNAYESGFDFAPRTTSYQAKIVELNKRLGNRYKRPTIHNLTLAFDDGVVSIPVFDFASLLSGLLDDPVLNRLENLVVNKSNGLRFHKFISENDILGEINTGQWYHDAYNKLVRNPEKDFLCPIIFYMDKTTHSKYSKLTTYSISFTTSIFNLKVSIPLQ